MIPELCQLSARALSERIRRQELSPVEVVDAHLAHIEATDPAINSFITVTGDHARERAREAEAEIAAGNWRGPLHGIPYAPKDILATAGILTTNGSKATADWVPDYESTITARLNDAGAILVGKLNLLEFAMGSGVLSGFGPARNPWATDYTPSGSSSGSGAALAARQVPLSIGTDTGGSIRGPAAACGIVGLKQTYGRISRFGVTTLSWTLDHAGPMTRTAWDAAAMLGAIAGPDPRDPTAADAPVPDYLAGLTPEVAGLRIGVPVSGSSRRPPKRSRRQSGPPSDFSPPTARKRWRSRCRTPISREAPAGSSRWRRRRPSTKNASLSSPRISIRWCANAWRLPSSIRLPITSRRCGYGPSCNRRWPRSFDSAM